MFKDPGETAMGGGSQWVVLVAVRHGIQERSAAMDALRMREMRQLIARASAVASLATTLALIAPEFLQEWESTAVGLPQCNLFVHAREDAPILGVTRVLATIRARDARARVILIPADHCAAIESAWVQSAKGALSRIEEWDDRVYLLHDQTQADRHFAKVADEFCSTTVIVGSADSLLHLSEGSKTTKVLDLMTSEIAEPLQSPPGETTSGATPINLIHVRLVEEYERIQGGRDRRLSTGGLDVTA